MLAWPILALFSWAAAFEFEKSFENVKLDRSVDLSGSYPKSSVQVDAKNIAEQPVQTYIISIPQFEAENLAVIQAEWQSGEKRGTGLPIKELASSVDEEVRHFVVTFPQSISPGETVSFNYVTICIDALEPLPKKITQKESQVMLYNTVKKLLSVYDTAEQTLHIKTLTQNHRELVDGDYTPFDFSKGSPDALGDATSFGPFYDVPANTYEALAFQFENPFPLGLVKRLERTIWVSHWGNSVSFDESYDLTNMGPELKGGFSRIDFHKAGLQPTHGKFSVNHAAVRALRFNIPSPARDAYYVDLVGNVSSSKISHSKSKADSFIDVIPRFPVFGGWSYNFTLGWTNSLGKFVHSVGDSRYIVSVPLVFGPIDTGYEEVESTIVLPEGAKVVAIDKGSYNAVEEGEIFSYLDLKGRTALKFYFKNLVSEHRKAKITVEYEYSTFAALQKPISISVSVFSVFAVLWMVSKFLHV